MLFLTSSAGFDRRSAEGQRQQLVRDSPQRSGRRSEEDLRRGQKKQRYVNGAPPRDRRGFQYYKHENILKIYIKLNLIYYIFPLFPFNL